MSESGEMPTLGLEDISELTGVAAGIAVAAAGAAVVNVVGAAFDELVDVLFFMLLEDHCAEVKVHMRRLCKIKATSSSLVHFFPLRA